MFVLFHFRRTIKLWTEYVVGTFNYTLFLLCTFTGLKGQLKCRKFKRDRVIYGFKSLKLQRNNSRKQS